MAQQSRTYQINLGLSGVSRVIGGLGQIGSAVTRLIGPLTVFAAGGAIARGVQTAIRLGDESAKAAQKIGVTVQELTRLDFIARLSNVSLSQLQTGTRELGNWLARTGRGTADVNEELLRQADIFAAMPDGMEKVRLAQQRFGRSGQDLIPLLNQGSEAIRQQMEDADLFGATIGPRFATRATEFRDNLTRIGTIFRGIWNMVANALLPSLNRFLEWIISFARESHAHIAIAETIIDTYRNMAQVVATVSGHFQSLAAFLGAFSGALSVTVNPFEAWHAGLDASKRALDAMEESLARIDRIRLEPPEPDERRDHRIALVDEETNRRMQLAELERQVELAQRGMDLSRAQRNRMLRGIYEDQLRLIREQLEEINHLTTLATDPDTGDVRFTRAYEEAIEAIHRLEKAQDELVDKMRSIDIEETFAARLTYRMREMADEWENIAVRIADLATNTIRRGIDSVADGIWDVVDGTRTWADIFRQAARSIISDLIRIVLQWVVGRLTMKATTIAAESAETAAKAPNALLTSITSWGIAALIGMAAFIAAMAITGGFARGGYTGDGPLDQVAGAVHKGEFVVSNRGVRNVGTDVLSSINSGLVNAADIASGIPMGVAGAVPSDVGPSAPLAAAAAEGRSTELTLILVDNQDDGLRALESARGEARIIQVVKNAKLEIGIPT